MINNTFNIEQVQRMKRMVPKLRCTINRYLCDAIENFAAFANLWKLFVTWLINWLNLVNKFGLRFKILASINFTFT